MPQHALAYHHLRGEGGGGGGGGSKCLRVLMSNTQEKHDTQHHHKLNECIENLDSGSVAGLCSYNLNG